MASVVNECVPLYEDADRVTGYATAAITGKRFVTISADRQGTYTNGLDATATGGNLSVAPATAAGAIFGVAAYDVASGGRVAVIREGIVPVTAGGTIAAGADVEVGTNGQAVTLASGKRVGQAVTAGTNGNDVFVALYL